MKIRHPRLLTLLGLLLCLPSALQAGSTPSSASPTPAAANTNSLDPDTVYSVLAAELAGQRNKPEVSFANYLAQAKKNKDPAMAERATHIAQQMRDDGRIVEAATVWVSLAPDHAEPRTVLIGQLSKTNRHSEIAPHVEAILKNNPDADLQGIAIGAENLTPANAAALTAVLQKASVHYPNNLSLYLTMARLHMAQKEWDAAFADTAAALSKKPLDVTALLMQADVLLYQKKTSVAVEKVRTAIEKGAEGKRIQLYYGRLLLADKQPDAARKQFDHTLEIYPDDAELLLTVALLAFDGRLLNGARDYFHQLLQVGAYEPEAHYYLGQINQDEKKYDLALEHYQKIDAYSDVYLAGLANTVTILVLQNKNDAAITKIQQARNANPDMAVDLYILEGDLLLKQKRPHDAITLLTKALKEHPNDGDLIYERSLAAEQAGNLALAEKDLRFLISKNPKDAAALNALGYTLASRTNRLQEALQLISQALKLRPDDGAIIDSMGWVHYRLGNNEKALVYLQRAYAKMPEDEIASHLVEVLWAMGKKQEAEEIYKDALNEIPDATMTKAIYERLTKSPR